MVTISRLLKEEAGQGMAEYALIIALVAVVLVSAFKNFSSLVNNSIQDSASKLP